MIPAVGYAAPGVKASLRPVSFFRRKVGPRDVQIDVAFCGVCRSDIHQAKNEWSNSVYPCMPGHEIVGFVKAVGAEVTRHKVGDRVCIGCMVESCRECEPCRAGEQNYCEGPESWLATYNGPMQPQQKGETFGYQNTFGGYSNVYVANEDFVLRAPDALPIEAVGPICCAGVTTYSPLKKFGVKAGDKVGVVGLGGLGHMAVKLAKAMGAEVWVFTHHKEKLEEAKSLGADGAVLETSAADLEEHELTFDFILDTVPKKHPIDLLIPCLKRDKHYVVVGQIGPLGPINFQEVLMHRRHLAGSVIGSLDETQEVLDFCAKHGVTPDTQVIPIDRINEAYAEVEAGDVRFRYVIDMSTLDASAPYEPAEPGKSEPR